MTKDGSGLTLFTVAVDGKPKRRDGTPINAARWQHTAGLTHACLNNSGCAEYFTSLTNAIRRDTRCKDVTCNHQRTVVHTGSGGFWVERLCKDIDRFAWRSETSDLCTASMSSSYRRRKDPEKFPHLKNLFACYFHDDKAHLASAARILKAANKPIVLDTCTFNMHWCGFNFGINTCTSINMYPRQSALDLFIFLLTYTPLLFLNNRSTWVQVVVPLQST